MYHPQTKKLKRGNHANHTQVVLSSAMLLRFLFFFRISSSHIVNSVCWSHALVNGPTSKRPASDGGLCSGQLLMMWSAVCTGSIHSHAALSASPHFFMDSLYRPTPVRSLLRVVQCFRLRSSALTPSPGSDTWRFIRVVRMLSTPASAMPLSMHHSTDPHG